MMRKESGVLSVVVDEINAGFERQGKDERVVLLGCTPKVEHGDGRWRNLDGTFAGKNA